jgi:hypothetical protein
MNSMWNGYKASFFRNHDMRWRSVVRVTPLATHGDSNPDTSCIRGWVVPKAGLDAVERRPASCLWRESKAVWNVEYLILGRRVRLLLKWDDFCLRYWCLLNKKELVHTCKNSKTAEIRLLLSSEWQDTLLSQKSRTSPRIGEWISSSVYNQTETHQVRRLSRWFRFTQSYTCVKKREGRH